jgi:hypothetical protein
VNKPIIPPSEHSHEAKHAEANKRKAVEEHKQSTVSHPGGFKNDPDDPTNPNEAIERHRRGLRR